MCMEQSDDVESIRFERTESLDGEARVPASCEPISQEIESNGEKLYETRQSEQNDQRKSEDDNGVMTMIEFCAYQASANVPNDCKIINGTSNETFYSLEYLQVDFPINNSTNVFAKVNTRET